MVESVFHLVFSSIVLYHYLQAGFTDFTVVVDTLLEQRHDNSTLSDESDIVFTESRYYQFFKLRASSFQCSQVKVLHELNLLQRH